MILSDHEIIRQLQNIEVDTLSISPWSEDMIQPCSVDLKLGAELKTLDGDVINLLKEDYSLKPQEFILGSTFETVRIPTFLCGELTGRSSIARLGVSCHQTAGFIDAGFNGNITLELFNASDKEFPLRVGDSICQLVLFALTNRALRPYGSEGLNSKYQDSQGTVESKL